MMTSSNPNCAQNVPDIEWSEDEIIFKNRYGPLKDHDVEFSVAADVKFRRSVFGTYMESFNAQQNQDKFLNENKLGMTKWDLETYEISDRISYAVRNDVTDQMLAILEEAVKEKDVIDWEFLYDRMRTLRISNCCVSSCTYLFISI